MYGCRDFIIPARFIPSFVVTGGSVPGDSGSSPAVPERGRGVAPGGISQAPRPYH
jgi:hypothetical protein